MNKIQTPVKDGGGSTIIDANGRQLVFGLMNDSERAEIIRAINALADHESLTEILQNCIDAIETLPQDVFGVGGDGETHWYVRDELLGRAKEVLRGKE